MPIQFILVFLVLVEMSAIVFNNFFCKVNNKHFKQLFQQIKHNSTAAHTLKIAERIKVKREEALLGGGQKRIEQQHKKVS